MLGRTTCLTTSTLVIAGAVMATMSEAPWLLYPNTPSLPDGIYLRISDSPTVGKIVAFRVPDAAVSYQQSIGVTVDPGFLFMKPIIAGPDDHVCNRAGSVLALNGRVIATIAKADHIGRPLPKWKGCRRLGADDYFTFSNHVPNSFDSRYYGPIKATDILGVYRSLLTFEPQFDDATSLGVAVDETAGRDGR